MRLLIPNRISIHMLRNKVFSQNVMVDFCQNKREMLLLLSNKLLWFVNTLTWVASFREKKKQNNPKKGILHGPDKCEELESENKP